MKRTKAGNLWLLEYFNLSGYSFTHCSYIGTNNQIEITPNGRVHQVYGPKYAPAEDNPFRHIVFSLKYDDLDLPFLKEVFDRIPETEIADLISFSPSGRYARKIGFLFEFLTRKQLDISTAISGNYIDLLDKERYLTGKTVKNKKWRINDNLPGTEDFCPVVRRTPLLDELLRWDIPGAIDLLKNSYPENIFRRAANYLYTKETRSSYEIEKEKPSPGRMERFVSILERAGRESQSEQLSEEKLTALQNAIVDPRFTASGYRNFQNYIGQTFPDFTEDIHYICPPPQYLISLMEGLQNCIEKTWDMEPLARAGIIAFGFVFLHPFEDGNGRIHRYLIHDSLVRDSVVPEGMIIPVSAYMLMNLREYDQVLENYSKPLLTKIRYIKEKDGDLKVINPDEVEAYFRYPDLTSQCIFLAQCIQATIKKSMPDELDFIQRYDELKNAVQNIVDMPDRLINLFIIFLHQNKGVFPKRRRKSFASLTDQEIRKIEIEYREVFR